MAKLTGTDLLEMFNEVKKEMKPFKQGSMKARFDIEGNMISGMKKPPFILRTLQLNW